MIPFTRPSTRVELERRGDALVDPTTAETIATFSGGVHRFVPPETYATNFGIQWNRWEHTLSDTRRGMDDKQRLLLDRTRFGELDLAGKTILECGCGGGDDTEVFLRLPFSEIHSFDLSNAVDRAARYLSDSRLVLSQANIYSIPYPDEAFDFVFCHRVLQHTPDPEAALRSVARKVKPGGHLFVHSYHRSWFFMSGYKYKLRWLTKRLPFEWIAAFLDAAGEPLHRVNERIAKGSTLTKFLGHSFVPFERFSPKQSRSRDEAIELSKLGTFDALTPTFDLPMKWPTMKALVEAEGFTITHFENRATSPLWCTATRSRSSTVSAG